MILVQIYLNWQFPKPREYIMLNNNHNSMLFVYLTNLYYNIFLLFQDLMEDVRGLESKYKDVVVLSENVIK